MNKVVVKSGPETYARVSKGYAAKHWLDERIDLCPVKLCPGGGFRSNITMHYDVNNVCPGPDAALQFDRLVRDFIWYNCTCNETGYYPAFYKVT